MMAVTDFTFKFFGETDSPESDGEMYTKLYAENEPYADEAHAEAAPLYAEDEHLEKEKTAQEEEFNDRILIMADPWYGVPHTITNVHTTGANSPLYLERKPDSAYTTCSPLAVFPDAPR